MNILDYARQRRVEMMEDWKRRNPDLWSEACLHRWDGPWRREATDRADILAQHEYLARNHGWPSKSAALYEIRPEEIRDQQHGELQLSFTAAQLDSLRSAGAALRKNPSKVFGWESTGHLASKIVSEAKE